MRAGQSQVRGLSGMSERKSSTGEEVGREELVEGAEVGDADGDEREGSRRWTKWSLRGSKVMGGVLSGSGSLVREEYG